MLAFTIYHLFSPWKIVIETRSASDPPITSPERVTDTIIPTPDGSGAALKEQSRKRDYIERGFGDLEQAFIKSIREPSDSPKRSRDDSIKLMYDITSASDWLNLLEGHDDHVGLPSVCFY